MIIKKDEMRQAVGERGWQQEVVEVVRTKSVQDNFTWPNFILNSMLN